MVFVRNITCPAERTCRQAPPHHRGSLPGRLRKRAYEPSLPSDLLPRRCLSRKALNAGCLMRHTDRGEELAANAVHSASGEAGGRFTVRLQHFAASTSGAKSKTAAAGGTAACRTRRETRPACSLSCASPPNAEWRTARNATGWPGSASGIPPVITELCLATAQCLAPAVIRRPRRGGGLSHAPRAGPCRSRG